ncbi:MAG: molecular chaperone HtpG [Saprospiraceae bacterium]|nr:molecular chaperone HtpG [Saprospiraceae bacterium]
MHTGTISVQTENIFPIIKQFLYSDQEIFLRELISNAVDATSKLKVLASKGEFKNELGDLTIEIILDEAAKTLTIRDKGIGLTGEEAEKYLNQVAFSSAAEFLEKYKDEANIIGHFGLGFYSAFMVSARVEVKSLSWKEGATGVTWACNGDPTYTLEENDKSERGTDVILHISDDAAEFLEKSRIEKLLKTYCKFLPIPIQFGTNTVTNTEGEGDDKVETTEEVPNIINNPDPIWRKQPAELTDENYKEFYQELFPYSADPLFWIHLNIDYPFNLTGVLYFPKLGNSMEVQKNKIQLYSNQVYVTDNVKDIVPEFLTLLHGIIDSPDIPLNVSRSALQADSHVKKITGYITRKVADKLHDLFKKDRTEFEQKWKDIGVFIKYGILSDEKFREKADKFVLLKNTEDKFFTLEEYKEKIGETQKDKHDKLVCIYTNDPEGQHTALEAAIAKGYDVLHFDTLLDNHFLQHLEYAGQNFTFVRVDSETPDQLVQKDETAEAVLSEDDQKSVKEWFESVVQNKLAHVELKGMSPNDQPVYITRPEFMRRMKEMQMIQGSGLGDFPESYNVVVNANHPLIAEKILNVTDTEEREKLVSHLYDLARLNQGMLKGKELTAFINKSLSLI